MRWLARIFANALARRIAVLLVASILAWMGVDSARAANCMTSADGCDQGQAYAAAWAYANSVSAGVSRAKACVVSYLPASPPYRGGRIAESSTCAAGAAWQVSASFFFGADKPCSARSPQSTLFLPPGGSTRCNNGCEAKYTWMGADSTGKETTMANFTGSVCNPDKGKDECNAKNPGGTSPPTWVWNGYLGVCQPINTECPAGQSSTPDGKCKSNDECPVTHVLNASGVCVKKDEDCAAGTVRGLDGICKQDDDTDKSKCGSGMAKGKDGTCKIDSNNDGIPDSDQDPDDPKNNEDGKQFSGGDNCNVPPTCSGDPIMCGQARIQWRIDCNTRKAANIAGGVCGSMPVCTGEGCKPMEYNQLIMQWRTACAVEKLAKQGAAAGEGEGNGTVPVPDTTGVGDGTLESALGTHGEGDAKDAFTDGSEGGQEGGLPGADGLNTEGFGWSRSCPAAPTIDLMGQSVTFDIGPFCNWMALGGWLVMIMAALLSLRIMASAGSA